MARNWNTTGLYKASRDRMPAKRSRRIKPTLPAARLVPTTPDPECSECGFGLTTKAHAEYCAKGISADPYDAGSAANTTGGRTDQ